MGLEFFFLVFWAFFVFEPFLLVPDSASRTETHSELDSITVAVLDSAVSSLYLLFYRDVSFSRWSLSFADLLFPSPEKELFELTYERSKLEEFCPVPVPVPLLLTMMRMLCSPTFFFIILFFWIASKDEKMVSLTISSPFFYCYCCCLIIFSTSV